MSNNIFLDGIDYSAPWFVKVEPGKTSAEPSVIVRDQEDTPVVKIHTRNKNHSRNTALIAHAPQLLAALIEYAYNAHTQGIPIRQELIDLIRDSGGPDLRSTLSPQ